MHNPIYSWRSTEEVGYIFEPATKVLKVGVHEIQTVGSLPVSSQSVRLSVPLHFSIQFTKAVMISIRKAGASAQEHLTSIAITVFVVPSLLQ